MKPLHPLLALAALTTGLSAQLPFRAEVASATGDPDYGRRAIGVGDIDGDGLGDFAVAESDTAPFETAGVVFVYSGADGAVIHTFQGQQGADGYGLAMALLGDVNGDGTNDLLLAASKHDELASAGGRLELRSLADGGVLWTVVGLNHLGQIGGELAEIGDVDGDGTLDFACTQSQDVEWRSGADGSLIGVYDVPGIFTPSAVGKAGDLTGDGVPDVLVGRAAGVGTGGESHVGAIEVISTATGSGTVHFAVFGDNYQEHLGRDLAGGLDLSGDGVPDFLGGAPGDDEAGAEGSLTVFSGADGSVLAKHLGDEDGEGGFGYHVAFVGDVNGDGAGDYAAVYDYTGTVGYSGYVRVFSGADHALLAEIRSEEPFDSFGSSFAALGDVNGDQLSDMIVGAKGDRKAYVTSVAGERGYGAAPEPGQTLTIAWASAGAPDPAQGTVEIANGPSSGLAFYLFGYAPASVDWGGVTQLVDLSGALILPMTLSLSGDLSLPTTLRTPGLSGVTTFSQLLVIDFGSAQFLKATPGLELRFTD